MKTQYLPWYAVALATVFVAALAFGVPLSTLALLLVVACPLMMMFMMSGMGGGRKNDIKHDSSDTPEHRDSAGRS
jgi:amino acid transporter